MTDIMASNLNVELLCEPPPILPDIKEQFEAYLTKPQNLPLHNQKNDFKLLKRKINLSSLYQIEPSPVTTTLKFIRDPDNKNLIDFEEVPVEGLGETSKNSTSFTRLPGKVTEDVRGSRTNLPFWPGGLDLPKISQTNEDADIDFDSNYLTVAPGLSRGFDFSSTAEKKNEQLEPTIDLCNVMEHFGKWNISSEDDKKTKGVAVDSTSNDLENNIIPREVKMPVLRISRGIAKTVTRTEYAELLDTTQPVLNFDKKVPDPAVKYDFDLDAFQKLAIMRLEDHEHVFVAAHTSAGKTVVAEYAIGLSQKHCTKTIYTSPIKALSNQKYRDFKNKFEDVGLITGDYRVNQQASCLIMTTEILRSMLYGASNIIRDVEFVIFDEVHYINDSERGHVWEEILIMLPSEVCIVMLSATVPNVLEFADWVGRTKTAKMYVVNTLKRPVPLQHYLYTGQEGKSENLFLIRDAEGPFILDGYNRALSSLERVKIENEKVKTIKKLAPLRSEKPYWISFAKYLKKYDKLPVVAFTLSRAKCDRNADLLTSIDLTTQEEKSKINHFFNESIRTLKEEDRNLPQILKMQLLLSQGIAKHHSGILPILKEIVEILFQKGWVKFLFATETFAMGVNMPAKTVAFDSIKKFDGTGTRNLQPAEYIQMAGRAGRRGQDETGTVIILCKQDIDNAENLRNMMTGPPTKLESQFRMTYSMILNLLRVKVMRVQDIMSHSFKELHSRRKIKNYEKELSELNEEDDDRFAEIKNNPAFIELEGFYEACLTFIENWKRNSTAVLGSAKVQKEIIPGRFVVISYKEHINKLALILQVARNCTEYRVLLLSDGEGSETIIDESDLFYRMLGLARKDIFVPDAKPKDVLCTITTESVVAITKYQIKLEFDLVLKDCAQRQLPRFKDNPPSTTCVRAITELIERSRQIQNDGGLRSSHFIDWKELRISNIDVSSQLQEIIRAKNAVESFSPAEKIPDFESQFKNVFACKLKEGRKERLKYLISDESLQLYPDYRNKINVLRRLKYINDEDIVEMKGKVACEMGSNELIITELIFQNSLSKYEPAEIAALLSCLVFQIRSDNSIEPELTDRLNEGISTVNKIHEGIQAVEVEYGYDCSPSLNFGLVQVVYEWAHGKPFAQIMELVEDKVQEGIIVRCIQQLNEILCDIKDAARLFGDLVLKKKMEEASDAIKRDIVFAASLYTQ